MIRLGHRILHIFRNRSYAAVSELDFSNPANSCYRGYYF